MNGRQAAAYGQVAAGGAADAEIWAPALRPLALEARLMFDGAALLTAEAMVSETGAHAFEKSTPGGLTLKGTVAQPVMLVVDSSEAGSLGTAVVPGEVVRYRMVVQLDAGAVNGAEIRPQLPAGVVFVNDGSAAVALIANQAGVTASGLPAGPGLNVTGGGLSVADIAAVRPTYVLPSSAIVDESGAPLSAGALLPSGAEPRFRLGNLVNADSDADGEFLVVEFNAIVANEASNTVGAAKVASFDWRNSTSVLDSSTAQSLFVGEPSIVNVDKRVWGVSGNQVTFEVTFSNTGSQAAHNVHIVDDFAGATNVSFAGAASVAGLPAGSVNGSDGDTLNVTIAKLAPGESVAVRYVGTLGVDWMPVPTRSATVTYTSLSASGEGLTTTVAGGTVVTATTGERTGDVSDPGGALNVYRDSDGVGLNKVRGTVWDDTNNADDTIGAGETKLQGVTVTLVHGGADGVLGTADDVTKVTQTNADGVFLFSAIPDGPYRISVPTKLTSTTGSGSLGELCARYDTQGDRRDGVIMRDVAGGIIQDGNDIGFVQINDAPTIAIPEPLCVTRDARLPITGVVVGDPDAGATDVLTVRLTASSGVLDVAPPAGSTVVVTGNGSGTVTLSGSITALNQTLATLGFQQVSGDCGQVKIQVKIDDHGRTGDANHNGIPNEPVADNLCAEATVCIDVKDPSAPPVTEHVVQVVSQSQSGRPVAVKPPFVQDPNDPNSALVVRIEAISRPEAGYFVLPDGSRLVAGQTITVEQLQHLSFVPRAGYVGPAGADGVMAGSTVSFSVADPCCGTACGSIEIRLTPVVTPVVPIDPIKPVQPDAVLPIVITPVEGVRPYPIVLEPLPLPDLDPVGLFPAVTVKGFFGDEQIGPLAPVPADEPVPAPAEDCAPVPKPKPKPIKKWAGEVHAKPVPKMSEQLDVQKKKFKLPAKVTPTPVNARQC